MLTPRKQLAHVFRRLPTKMQRMLRWLDSVITGGCSVDVTVQNRVEVETHEPRDD